MGLTEIAFTSGITSLMIVVIGWILGLYLLKRYLSSPDKNTLALAVILISVGSVWLAIAINFIFALTNQPYLGNTAYILVIGWIPGVTGLAIAFVFTSIMKEEYLTYAMIIFGLIFIINMLIVYGLIAFNIDGLSWKDEISFTATPNTELPNASTVGYFLVLSVISIVIMLATSIFFIITSFRTDIPIVKARAGLIGIGLLIIAILITFDSVIDLTDIVSLVIVRILIVVGLFILAIAITLPKRIFKNLA